MARVNPAKVPWSLAEVLACAAMYLVALNNLAAGPGLVGLGTPTAAFFLYLLSSLPLLIFPVLAVGLLHQKVLFAAWLSPNTALRDMAIGLHFFLIFGLINALALQYHLGPAIDHGDLTHLAPWQVQAFNVTRVQDVFLLAIGLGAMGPLCEEVFFRGYLYPALRRRLPAAPAIILCSAVFALFHADSRLWPLAFLLSLVVTTVFEYSASLIGPILIHMGANLSSVLLTVNHGTFADSLPPVLVLAALALLIFHMLWMSWTAVPQAVTVHVTQGEGEPLGKGEIPDGERLGGSLALPATLKNDARNEVRERQPRADRQAETAERETSPTMEAAAAEIPAVEGPPAEGIGAQTSQDTEPVTEETEPRHQEPAP